LWARLNYEGILVSGSHVVSTSGSPGGYDVTFDRDISECAAVATPNGPGPDVVVVGAVSNSNTVVVLVATRAAGFPALDGVSLAVFCP
jgi:hypothetical protein